MVKWQLVFTKQAQKDAKKLASAGLKVKELIGGLDFWRRDSHPVTEGNEPGHWPEEPGLHDCGC